MAKSIIFEAQKQYDLFVIMFVNLILRFIKPPRETIQFFPSRHNVMQFASEYLRLNYSRRRGSRVRGWSINYGRYASVAAPAHRSCSARSLAAHFVVENDLLWLNVLCYLCASCVMPITDILEVIADLCIR